MVVVSENVLWWISKAVGRLGLGGALLPLLRKKKKKKKKEEKNYTHGSFQSAVITFNLVTLVSPISQGEAVETGMSA